MTVELISKHISAVEFGYEINTGLQQGRMVFITVRTASKNYDVCMEFADALMSEILKQTWMMESIMTVDVTNTINGKGMVITSNDVVHIDEFRVVGESVGLELADVRYLEGKYMTQYRPKKEIDE